MDKPIIGYVHSLETLGLLDGPGIRTIFFLQGCPLRCAFCHNPDTQDVKKTNPYLPDDILRIVNKYKTYYGTDGGVTFSGGEPLLQGAFLSKTLKLLKKNNINTCVDTSGFGDEKYYKEIFPFVDTILLDVKSFQSQKFKNLVKADFQTFLNFINNLENNNFSGNIWIRHVMIPGYTDNKESMKELIKVINPIIEYVEKIDILPYHTMGVQKYEQLGRKYPLEGILPMDKNKSKQLEIFANKLLAEALHLIRNIQKRRSVMYMDGYKKKYITGEEKEKLKDKIIADIDLLKNIPKEIVSEIYDKSLIYSVEKGEFIFKSHDDAIDMYVILEGKAKIFYNTIDGKEQIYYIYNKGDFVGGHNLLSGENYLYNAQAITHMTVLSISKEVFGEYMKNNINVLNNILSKSFERIRWAEGLIQRLSTTNTSMRVAALLLKMSENSKNNENNSIKLNLELTREELGNYLGLTRETITRKLSEFKDLGYIDLKGNKTLIIKDLQSLRHYSM